MGDDGIKPHYAIDNAEEHLYDVTTFGRTILTTVTKSSEAVRKWIQEVQPDDVVHRFIGFDAELFCEEGKPSRIGTIQFCVGDRCLIIQIHRMWISVCTSLWDFLIDRNNTFVGINMTLKMGILLKNLPFNEVKYRDLRELAADLYRWPRLRSVGLRELVETVLGMTVVKPPFEKDWDRAEKLSDGQVYCACVDAYVCFLLGRWLLRV